MAATETGATPQLQEEKRGEMSEQGKKLQKRNNFFDRHRRRLRGRPRAPRLLGARKTPPTGSRSARVGVGDPLLAESGCDATADDVCSLFLLLLLFSSSSSSSSSSSPPPPLPPPLKSRRRMRKKSLLPLPAFLLILTPLLRVASSFFRAGGALARRRGVISFGVGRIGRRKTSEEQ